MPLNALDEEINDPKLQPHRQELPSQYLRTTEDSETNSLFAPIGELPDEILGEIFTYVRDDSPSIDINDLDEAEQLEISYQQIQWVTVSHVCRRWRKVALSTATLWMEPPLIFPLWAATMFQRSRMAAIRSLDANWSSMKSEVISSAIRHLPRVIDFTLRQVGSENLEELSREISNVETPRLQSLRIRPKGYLLANRDQARQGFILPDDVFTKTRNFCILDLWSVDISWSSHLLSSLTELALRDISYARRPTVDQLRSMLEGMPSLQVLYLCDALPVSNSTGGSGERVALWHLKELLLGGKSLELKTFALNVAPGSKLETLHIDLLHEGETTDELQSSQKALTQSCPLSNIEVVSVFGPDNDDEGSWSFEIYANTGTEVHHEQHQIGHEALMITFRAGVFVGNTWITENGYGKKLRFLQLFQTVNWNHLSRLDLTPLEKPEIVDTPSSALLVQTFGTLSSLKEVITGNTMAWILIEALNATDQTQYADNFIPFPGLECIHLTSVSFLEEDNNKPHLHVGALADCIVKRYENGFPICSVVLENCTGLVEEEANLLSSGVMELVFLPESENVHLGSLADREIVCCSAAS